MKRFTDQIAGGHAIDSHSHADAANMYTDLASTCFDGHAQGMSHGQTMDQIMNAAGLGSTQHSHSV